MTSSERQYRLSDLASREAKRRAIEAIEVARARYGRRGKSKRSVEEAVRLAMLAREVVEELFESGYYSYDEERRILTININQAKHRQPKPQS